MIRQLRARLDAIPALWESSISRKTQGAVSLALLLILAILYLTLRLVVLRSFSMVEQRYADQAIMATTRAIDDQIGLLDRSVIDYAVWDDTYAFLQGEQGNYVASNFTESMFMANQLDMVILVDRGGATAYQHIHGISGELAPDKQAAVLEAIRASGALAPGGEDGPRHTVLLTPHKPLMLSAHRVLRSDRSGPSNGVFLMGRWIDAELEQELSERLLLTISFMRLDEGLQANLPPEARALAGGQGSSVTVPIDSRQLGSYSLVRDAAGQPQALAQIRSDRPIWAAGQQTILVSLAVFIIGGAAFIVSVGLLLDRLALARLRRLTEGVHTIGTRQDLGQRVAIDGSDELGLLARTINETMAAIEQADRERRRAEEEREELWRELARSRRAFIATVSHELRTPLTPIRGYVDMLLQGIGGPLAPEQDEFVRAIHQNALRMERMVNDLLAIGQLEAGQVRLEREPLAAEEVVRSVLSMLEHRLSVARLGVRLRFAAELPPIDADPYRVEQILANLLSNAIKYTPPGGTITVETSLAGGAVEIAVSDTGMGISAAEQERLFTPFYRTPGAISQHIPGSGLGLSIVRSLVQLHGGEITVSSAPGAGSTFRVRLPISAGEAPRQAPQAQTSTVAS